jgi:hypothetical protein
MAEALVQHRLSCVPQMLHNSTIKAPCNDVRTLWPVALPLLASRRECPFLFEVAVTVRLLMRVECGASCPNPSTRQKLMEEDAATHKSDNMVG